jgi:hypothetical protein
MDVRPERLVAENASRAPLRLDQFPAYQIDFGACKGLALRIFFTATATMSGRNRSGVVVALSTTLRRTSSTGKRALTSGSRRTPRAGRMYARSPLQIPPVRSVRGLDFMEQF